MRTYKEYKDSGVKWMGEVPIHWEICRFKDFMSLQTQVSLLENKIGLENIESATGRFIETDSEFEGNGIAFDVGDIIYGKLRPYLRKVWLSTFKGNAIGDFFVFRAKNTNSASYIKYVMLSDGFTKEANGSTFGAKMPRVSSNVIMSMRYFLPPPSEQQAIADYLDTKTSEIDGMVAKAEKKIEYLSELKQSLITRAVTRGLNPNVEMLKIQGMWVSHVPSHWKVLRLKHIAFMQSGDNLTSLDIKDKGDYIVYGGNGQRGYYDDYNCDGRHVLIGRQGALAGNIHLVDGKLWATDHAVVTYIKGNNNISYFAYLLEAMHLNQYAYETSAQPGLAVSKISNLKTVLAPILEQNQIADYLDTKCSKIDHIIATQKAKIAYLQELKQSLITNVVTGKIKVS